MPPTQVLQSTLPLGTGKDNAIEVDSDISEEHFLHIEMDEFTGTAVFISLSYLNNPTNLLCFLILARYCPLRNGNVQTSIIITGRIGVWRVHNYELDKSDDHVRKCLATEEPPFQPEEFNEFTLVEVCSGMFMGGSWV